MSPDLLPLMLFAPVLVFAGASDLTRMRIPNWTSLAAIGLFVLALPILGLDEALWRLAVAGTIFALGLGLWALRMFGAGDVKLLSALLLLVPVAEIALFWQVLSASLLIGLAAVTGLRASGVLRATGWTSMRAHGQFPMGISIALAGVALPLVA